MSSISHGGGDLRLPSWTLGGRDAEKAQPAAAAAFLQHVQSHAVQNATRTSPNTATQLRKPEILPEHRFLNDPQL